MKCHYKDMLMIVTHENGKSHVGLWKVSSRYLLIGSWVPNMFMISFAEAPTDTLTLFYSILIELISWILTISMLRYVGGRVCDDLGWSTGVGPQKDLIGKYVDGSLQYTLLILYGIFFGVLQYQCHEKSPRHLMEFWFRPKRTKMEFWYVLGFACPLITNLHSLEVSVYDFQGIGQVIKSLIRMWRTWW